jgi:hypothetical protein
MNNYATWKANEAKRAIPPKITTAFKEFISEIRRDHKQDWLDGRTDLSRAFYAFQRAHDELSKA